MKHFELATDETRPDQRRRLETRLLVRDEAGGVFGATYKWRADNSDADLLTEGATERLAVRTAAGTRTQVWFYPSRQDCVTCHTALSGGVLGVKTRQLNRSVTDSSGDRREPAARLESDRAVSDEARRRRARPAPEARAPR